MLQERSTERNRAGPEATFAALWSEAPCCFDEVSCGPAGDPRMVERLFRKLRGRDVSARKRSNPRLRQKLSRPQLDEET
jgi:hypothetical protein